MPRLSEITDQQGQNVVRLSDISQPQDTKGLRLSQVTQPQFITNLQKNAQQTRQQLLEHPIKTNIRLALGPIAQKETWQPITKTLGFKSPSEVIDKKLVRNPIIGENPHMYALKMLGAEGLKSLADTLTTPGVYAINPISKAVMWQVASMPAGRAFLQKYFPTFAKKLLTKTDPEGIAYQKWLKERTPLSSRGATPTKPITIKPGVAQPETRIKLETHKDIAQRAAEIIAKDPNSKIAQNESQRLFRRIGESLASGEINARQLPEILNKYKITPEQFADMYLENISTSGRELNILSQLQRQLQQVLGKEAFKKLSKLPSKPKDLYQTVADAYRKVDNVRRASMVAQMATAARNAISQQARYTLNVFDDAIQGTVKTLTRKETPRQAYANLIQDVTAVVRRMTPSGRARLEGILEQYPLEKAKLLTAPIHDISLGDKYSRFIMTFNRIQEYFFRKMAFDARITALAQKEGIDLTTGEMPIRLLNDALHHSLELTYAAKGFQPLMQLYKHVPFFTTIHPYPRFWSNALRFLWDFNPTGYLSAASRAIMTKDLRDPIAIARFSKATLGTLMLGVGREIRTNPNIGGEKWYEIKLGEKTIDTRAFAPFSTYLFLAEAMENPERLRGKDWAQGVVSINRIAGTGLVLVDVLRGQSFDSTRRMLEEVAGNWIGGFSVPLRTVSDIMGEYREEERVGRSTRESPLVAPFLTNIPYAQRALPKAPRLTRGEAFERESPLLRQFTGLTVKTKTPLEREIDRLALQRIYPRTGDKTLDRLITTRIGRAISVEGQKLVSDPIYKRSDDEAKEDMIKELISQFRQLGKNAVQPKYVVGKLDSFKTMKEREDYLKKLIKKNKISQQNLKEVHRIIRDRRK